MPSGESAGHSAGDSCSPELRDRCIARTEVADFLPHIVVCARPDRRVAHTYNVRARRQLLSSIAGKTASLYAQRPIGGLVSAFRAGDRRAHRIGEAYGMCSRSRRFARHLVDDEDSASQPVTTWSKVCIRIRSPHTHVSGTPARELRLWVPLSAVEKDKAMTIVRSNGGSKRPASWLLITCVERDSVRPHAEFGGHRSAAGDSRRSPRDRTSSRSARTARESARSIRVDVLDAPNSSVAIDGDDRSREGETCTVCPHTPRATISPSSIHHWTRSSRR